MDFNPGNSTSTIPTPCLFCLKKSSSLKNQSTRELLRNEELFLFLCKYLEIPAKKDLFQFNFLELVEEEMMLPVCTKCTKTYKQLAELYTEFQELEKEIKTVAEEFRQVVILSSTDSNGGDHIGRRNCAASDRFRGQVAQKGTVELNNAEVEVKEEADELPVDIRALDMMEIVKEEPFEKNFEIDNLSENGCGEELEIENNSDSFKITENMNKLKEPSVDKSQPEMIDGDSDSQNPEDEEFKSESPCSINFKKNKRSSEFIGPPRRSLRAQNSKQTETSKPEQSLRRKRKCNVKPKRKQRQSVEVDSDYSKDDDFNDKTDEVKEDEDTSSSLGKRTHFVCKFCPSSFEAFVQLYDHYTTNHPNEKPFDCYKCPENFSSRPDLHDHIKKSHPSEWAKRSSTIYFRSRLTGQEGVLEQLRFRKKEYICQACDMDFGYRGALHYHRKQHELNEPKKTLSCTICKKMFASHHNLDRHVALHKLEETKTKDLFMCKDCDLVCKSQETLDNHITDTHQRGVVKFVCTICGQKFTSRIGFKRHNDTHAGKKPEISRCKHCPETFLHNSILRTHMFHKHPELAPDFSCTICLKKCADQQRLNSHVLTHSKSEADNKFACEICHARFKTRAGIAGHKISKHGAEQLSCKICGKTYNSASGLKMHTQYKHSAKEKSHVCTICNKAFYSKYKLDRHVNHHGDARPFICEICGKGFKTDSNLYSHREFFHKAESNQRYRCDICGKTFSWSTSYRVHKKAHHPDAIDESSGPSLSKKGRKTSKKEEPPCNSAPAETSKANATQYLNLNAFNTEHFN